MCVGLCYQLSIQTPKYLACPIIKNGKKYAFVSNLATYSDLFTHEAPPERFLIKTSKLNRYLSEICQHIFFSFALYFSINA
jgi:hypothetical protein